MISTRIAERPNKNELRLNPLSTEVMISTWSWLAEPVPAIESLNPLSTEVMISTKEKEQ